MKKAKKKAVIKVTKPAAKKKSTVKAAPQAATLKIQNKSGVTPLADRVVVEPTSPETTTSFGLIIPETASKEKPETGFVVAVGPGKTADDGSLVPVGVSVGDKIMFNNY